MAGYFIIGEKKVRPGSYFNVQSGGNESDYGAVDGVVAILFRASMGPICKAQILSVRDSSYADVFGNDGTTDAIQEAISGGASKIVAVRIGSGGAAGSASLSAATGKLKVTAKYPGKANFAVTVRAKLADSTQKEIIFFKDAAEFEKFSFAAGDDEVAAAIEAAKESKMFDLSAEDEGKGIITNVSQTALSGGTDPTVTNQDYSNALKEVEKYYFNAIAVDTEEASVQTLVTAFLDRIYNAGQFGVAFFAPAATTTLEERMSMAAAFNAENVGFVVNPKTYIGKEERKGYQIAAGIAGVFASTPSNLSITHAVMRRYTELGEVLTPSEVEAAEKKGCLVLTTNKDGAVWLDNSVNTLITPDANHDNGWKKLRRVKTRYELLYRANAAADDLVGKVDNDVNGRATIAKHIKDVGSDMINEGKLAALTVTESTVYSSDGDYCYFDLDVVDKDSAEHIYMTYYFRFSTAVE